MSLKAGKKDNWYLHDTHIENIVISEYMAKAPGDYVKVYLYGLMNAQLDMDISKEAIAKDLSLEQETVEKAIAYWEKHGVIKAFGSDIEFLSLKGMQVEPKEMPKKISPLEDEELKLLIQQIEYISGKQLNGSDLKTIEEWLYEWGVDLEVILYAYDHFSKIDSEKVNCRYIGKVLKAWLGEGLSNADEVSKYLEEHGARNNLYRRIFRALGFNRNWTENEADTMDKWLDEYGFSMERILEACGKTSGISSPNINYVNKVLENWNEESKKSDGTAAEGVGKKISMGTVLRYYEYLKEKEEKEAENRRQDAFSKIPKLRRVEERLKSLSIELSKSMFSNSTKDADEIRKKIDSMSVEKAVLLTENNLPADYMEVKYLCEKCRDTGIDESGERCECFSQRMGEAAVWLKEEKES